MTFLDAAGQASEAAQLLGPADIRALARELGIRPTKTLGQNFVHDAGTVRRIARDADIGPCDRVLEIGPGLGSLTLALLETGACVSAVEIDPLLAAVLPATVKARMPQASGRFALAQCDALTIDGVADLAVPPLAGAAPYVPEHLVANLPYNVAVPVLLTLLEVLPSLKTALVMVQSEVADRLAAEPGSRTYGAPSVKLAWYGQARRGAKIGRSVFWPVPNVDSALVSFRRNASPRDASPQDAAQRASNISREEVFAVVDHAFAQRRKTLRAALAEWAGSPSSAEQILRRAGLDPGVRGERLSVNEFIAIATAARLITESEGGLD
ncbi:MULTISPECIES: 16S rRNA (adenine(1518)-N(6)/adenine(1519)-N(6))-dimethyltransferase RsmA [unclassified Actinobaculum]|uniref:16S rRNA (adenine(1518)-N(6)/adenine(1519)-N(6))- dimethyltransferase RsmA n=1 Tax=unclassified Actinobaculum TaxID=2609299 RepID=UPI000D529D3B|nr:MULTISPECIES: 16S rRNA (adenine(1518)-N(6)/adenine(1519)-N(6))-dimethyltransferase RsmA [unclassified Actinobaculum]AWE41803.1 16S rRNA (adenine(1518)-N(6)/adenine(1519)-N(6))-dimethyltransferase [Actinobaculum sp. 313]RTE50277.1 16S rRNA (adenine(1518)-N(6)/adenine(1519)-N(6))-dimethyltransferase RsmA [Actinobaculum sp. 352]